MRRFLILGLAVLGFCFTATAEMKPPARQISVTTNTWVTIIIPGTSNTAQSALDFIDSALTRLPTLYVQTNSVLVLNLNNANSRIGAGTITLGGEARTNWGTYLSPTSSITFGAIVLGGESRTNWADVTPTSTQLLTFSNAGSSIAVGTLAVGTLGLGGVTRTNWYQNPYMFQVGSTGGQALAHNTYTALGFEQASGGPYFDTANMWHNGSGFVAPLAGKYRYELQVHLARTNALGYWFCNYGPSTDTPDNPGAMLTTAFVQPTDSNLTARCSGILVCATGSTNAFYMRSFTGSCTGQLPTVAVSPYRVTTGSYVHRLSVEYLGP